jgi:16S rRNA (cytosine1402-N4)-methyltransferase
MTATVHVPILLEPIVKGLTEPLTRLAPDAPAEWIVDCTLGGGGHTGALLERLAADPALARHRVLSVDQDEQALARARERFAAELADGRLELRHSRFGEIDLSDRVVAGLMADLGFSSDQLEDAERGLSFQSDGPLDMRLDRSRGLSAREWIGQASETDLKEALSEYGEERFSGRIASAIKRAHAQSPLATTRQLAEVIERAVPPEARHGRIHAATRTFQALRIVVNEELNELDALLGRVILSVRPGGRVAILSFHSLEDRKVKQAFKRRGGPFDPLSKKPVEADEEEIRRNPRSRSAKLRIAERVDA